VSWGGDVADTGPTGLCRETRTDPTEFLGDPGRIKVRSGPCSGI